MALQFSSLWTGGLNVPNSSLELTSLRQDSFMSSKTTDAEVSVVLADPQNLDTASGVVQFTSGKTRTATKQAKSREARGINSSCKVTADRAASLHAHLPLPRPCDQLEQGRVRQTVISFKSATSPNGAELKTCVCIDSSLPSERNEVTDAGRAHYSSSIEPIFGEPDL